MASSKLSPSEISTIDRKPDVLYSSALLGVFPTFIQTVSGLTCVDNAPGRGKQVINRSD